VLAFPHFHSKKVIRKNNVGQSQNSQATSAWLIEFTGLCCCMCGLTLELVRPGAPPDCDLRCPSNVPRRCWSATSSCCQATRAFPWPI
jgi:hypothetical protein